MSTPLKQALVEAAWLLQAVVAGVVALSGQNVWHGYRPDILQILYDLPSNLHALTQTVYHLIRNCSVRLEVAGLTPLCCFEQVLHHRISTGHGSLVPRVRPASPPESFQSSHASN